MKKINEVYETNDYNMFSLLKNNREVNKSHVKKLSKSMQKIRLITPIIINEKGQIIDGQHRFHAQKNLNLSIPYVVEEAYGEEEARILNLNTSNWKLHDWVRHYCNLNNNNYLMYKSFKDRYCFESDQCQHILTQGNFKGRKVFLDGHFKVGSISAANRYADDICAVKPYFVHYKERFFVRAMIHCFKEEELGKKNLNLSNPYYTHKRFLHKLKYQGNSLIKCVDKKSYLRLIESICNRGVQEKNKMRLF